MQVLNASGVTGAEKEIAKKIEDAGWKDVKTEPGRSASSTSVVYYADDFEEEAKELAELIGVEEVESSSEYSTDITLLLNSDIAKNAGSEEPSDEASSGSGEGAGEDTDGVANSRTGGGSGSGSSGRSGDRSGGAGRESGRGGSDKSDGSDGGAGDQSGGGSDGGAGDPSGEEAGVSE